LYLAAIRYAAALKLPSEPAAFTLEATGQPPCPLLPDQV
jgi:hypothetical protein